VISDWSWEWPGNEARVTGFKSCWQNIAILQLLLKVGNSGDGAIQVPPYYLCLQEVLNCNIDNVLFTTDSYQWIAVTTSPAHPIKPWICQFELAVQEER